MIGHQVLLSTGDSSSIVMPVERLGDLYKIHFSSDFGFDPESIAIPIDSVIRETGISENYIVEFVSCNTEQVIHSYEIGENADVIACQGRAQPVACYELWISILDGGSQTALEADNSRSPIETGTVSDRTLLFVLGLSAIALFSLLLAYIMKRRARSSLDPNEVQMGEFIFKQKSMELIYKGERIELTGKESDLLQLLSASANDTVEREDILKEVWGDEGVYVGRTLDVFISKLRKKLELDSNVRIVNIRGVGYKLVLND
jgi:hypothetical protein